MSKINIVPLGNRVVVQPKEKEETKSASGIILPDSAQEDKSNIGTVVAVGEKVKEVSENDTVLYTEYGHETITIDDIDYKIMGEDKLLAVIK